MGLVMRNLAFAALALAALCRIAAADPGEDAPHKDPTTAVLWSIGGTAASGALLIAGISGNNATLTTAGAISSLVTPSLGEWYAGKYLTAGMGIRAASTVVMFAGVAQAISCWDSCSSGQSQDASAMVIGGLVGYAGGAIYDIATAGSAADDFNAKHRVHAMFAPTVLNPPSGPVMGAGLTGTF
jgi:hypothetical protein